MNSPLLFTRAWCELGFRVGLRCEGLVFSAMSEVRTPCLAESCGTISGVGRVGMPTTRLNIAAWAAFSFYRLSHKSQLS